MNDDMLNNRLLAVIQYDDAEWVWVSDHYDIHLAGLLRFNGDLCRFKSDYKNGAVYVYRLNFFEKLKCIANKKLFELCVGMHWSYPGDAGFYWRRPKWLHLALFNMYYATLAGKNK